MQNEDLIISQAKAYESNLDRLRHAIPFGFTEETVDALISELGSAYEIVKHLCEVHRGFPDRQLRDSWNRVRFRDLQRVHAVFRRISNAKAPIDLYFLVEALRDDFAKIIPRDHHAVLVDGDEFVTKKVEKFCLSSVLDIGKRALYGDRGVELADLVENSTLRIIHVPESSIWEPHSWVIIAHEFWHLIDQPHQHVNEVIPLLAEKIPVLQQEEVAIDLIEINHLGPAYGFMMLGLAKLAGTHGSDAHPTAKTRWIYLRSLLQWQLENVVPSLDPSTKSVSGYLATKTIQAIDAELEADPTKAHDHAIAEFISQKTNEIQEPLTKWLKERGVPAWTESLAIGIAESSLGKHESQELIESCRWLLERRLLPTTNPTVLFNLALLGEFSHPRVDRPKIKEAVHYSLRKWMVVQAYRITKQEISAKASLA